MVETVRLEIEPMSIVEIFWGKVVPLIVETVRLETDSSPATRLLTDAEPTSNTDEEILEIAWIVEKAVSVNVEISLQTRLPISPLDAFSVPVLIKGVKIESPHLNSFA